MSRRQHEIPTHLNVEDKLMLGLTVRQFLYLLVGTSLSYGLWDQAASLPLAVRASVVGMCLLVTLAMALLRPSGRPLEEWALAASMYAATPRQATWRPREPVTTDWRPASAAWQELAPDVAWAEEDVR